MGNGQPPSVRYPKDKDERKRVIDRNNAYVQSHIYALEDKQARDLIRLLEVARDRMAAQLVTAIMQNGGQWSAVDPNFRQRTDFAIQQISKELDRLIRDAQDQALGGMEAGYRGGYYGKAWVLDNGLRTGQPVNVPLLPSMAVRAALLAPYNGSTFIDRYADARADFVKALRGALVQSQINGDSIPDAVKRLAAALGLDVTRVGKDRGLRYRLEMIARTEILRASNMGAMAIYAANQDILQGWEFSATNDERTCDECGPLDGKRFAMDDTDNQPPLHPNCRCSVVPVLLDDELSKAIIGPQQTWSDWKAAQGPIDTGAL